MREASQMVYGDFAAKQAYGAAARPPRDMSQEATPVERAMIALEQLETQAETLLDQLRIRLERGGVLQPMVQPEHVPVSEAPAPSCRLVGELYQRAYALERLGMGLRTLMEQLAL
jgi:hypothetical protein